MSKSSVLTVGTFNRVRQQDRIVDTTPLNQRDDLCLRSPQKLKFSGTLIGAQEPLSGNRVQRYKKKLIYASVL